MIWIELLGPGGIGKSYLYNELAKRNSKLIGYHLVVPSRNFLSKFGLGPKPQNIHSLKFAYNEKEIFSIGTFLKGIEILYNNPLLKLEIYNYYHYRFKQLKFLSQTAAQNEVYLAEDGILHLNYGFSEENLPQMWLPDFIINLEASPEYIYANRVKRMKGGKPNTVEKLYQHSTELDKIIERNYALYKEKVTILKPYYQSRMLSVNVETTPFEQLLSIIQNQILAWHNH